MTRILLPDSSGVSEAAALLREGKLVAFGTETVYGLGADATNAAAVAGIFEAKRRPRFNPLICHYPHVDAAFVDVEASREAQRLAAAFWPGPLTMILPRSAGCAVARLTGAGLDTLAVRVPAHPVAMALLQSVGRPVAAPSANVSGQVSPTTAIHVLDGLGGRIAAVVDSGPCAIGVESTVVDLTDGAVVLRPGGLTVEALEAVLGPMGRRGPGFAADHATAPRSPGLLASHYAPALPLRLGARNFEEGEALLAFGSLLPGFQCVYQLSAAEDLSEAAARLFDGLRMLDAEGIRRGIVRIAVMPVPEHGLGRAINDRLRRAAAPRPEPVSGPAAGDHRRGAVTVL